MNMLRKIPISVTFLKVRLRYSINMEMEHTKLQKEPDVKNILIANLKGFITEQIASLIDATEMKQSNNKILHYVQFQHENYNIGIYWLCNINKTISGLYSKECGETKSSYTYIIINGTIEYVHENTKCCAKIKSEHENRLTEFQGFINSTCEITKKPNNVHNPVKLPVQIIKLLPEDLREFLENYKVIDEIFHDHIHEIIFSDKDDNKISLFTKYTEEKFLFYRMYCKQNNKTSYVNGVSIHQAEISREYYSVINEGSEIMKRFTKNYKTIVPNSNILSTASQKIYYDILKLVQEGNITQKYADEFITTEEKKLHKEAASRFDSRLHRNTHIIINDQRHIMLESISNEVEEKSNKLNKLKNFIKAFQENKEEVNSKFEGHLIQLFEKFK